MRVDRGVTEADEVLGGRRDAMLLVATHRRGAQTRHESGIRPVGAISDRAAKVAQDIDHWGEIHGEPQGAKVVSRRGGIGSDPGRRADAPVRGLGGKRVYAL